MFDIDECKKNGDKKINYNKCIQTLKDEVIKNFKNILICATVDAKFKENCNTCLDKENEACCALCTTTHICAHCMTCTERREPYCAC